MKKNKKFKKEKNTVSPSEAANKKTEDKDAAKTSEENMQPEKTPLEAAQEEIASLKDKYLRSIAEFDNYRKRTLKEKAELIKNGGEKTVIAVLPIFDDLERVIADKNEDSKAIKDGIKLIYKNFQNTIESIGVEKIETADKDFDADQMEAVATVPNMGENKKNKVIECVQSGYEMNNKVIRHAKVVVGQ